MTVAKALLTRRYQSNAAALLSRPVNQPIEQPGVDGGVRQTLGGPQMQPRLGRQAERACRAMTDEEEAVTAAVPSKAADIIVKFGLRRPGFNLHPGRLSDCGLGQDQVHVRLIL